MIILEKKQIDKAIPKVKEGLEKYLWIQRQINKRNTQNNREFQRKFNSFYRMRRNEEWQKKFYKLLEASKQKEIDFKNILVKLYKETNRVEASFASKLVATINPNMPIIDKIVFGNIGLKLPASYKKDRILIIIEQYYLLLKEFLSFLRTEHGKYLVDRFIKEYPHIKITKIKMLDLILWQTRG